MTAEWYWLSPWPPSWPCWSEPREHLVSFRYSFTSVFVQCVFIKHVLCASFCAGHGIGEGTVKKKMRLDTFLTLQEFTVSKGHEMSPNNHYNAMNQPESTEVPFVFCNSRLSEQIRTQKVRDSDIPSLAKTHLYALHGITR